MVIERLLIPMVFSSSAHPPVAQALVRRTDPDDVCRESAWNTFSGNLPARTAWLSNAIVTGRPSVTAAICKNPSGLKLLMVAKEK